jgi:Rrf2 family protein
MKISTKGRYALRLLLDIAQQPEGSVVSLKEISGRQDISVKYLEQIVLKLNKTGFLKSIRGVQGGYMLTRTPAEYNIGDVLRAVEGSLAPLTCLQSEINLCDRCDQCDTLWFWEGMDRAINDYVDRYTLQDFLDQLKGRDATCAEKEENESENPT